MNPDHGFLNAVYEENKKNICGSCDTTQNLSTAYFIKVITFSIVLDQPPILGLWI